MGDCRRLAVVLFCSIFSLTRGQNALTETEIALLRANNFTVTIGTDSITLAHHGLPENALERGWDNPNNAEMVNHSYTLPLQATVSEPKGCAGSLGVIGLAVSGGAFYNPYTGFGYNAVEGECKEALDLCTGHPSPDGTYHYHGIPHCLYTGDLRDIFLGVVLDGYPIYGPMDATGKNWTTADLDQCHGHYYNGRYMYRATYDFPYIISCFHGKDVKASQQQPSGGMGPPPQPPGRRRRHIDDHVHRRQAPLPPPGMENSSCFDAEYNNWSALTCIVVCENAGKNLSNCPSRSGYATTHSPVGGSTMTTASVLSTLGFSFIVCSGLIMIS